MVSDAYIFTEGTGDGHRDCMQIEVTVVGRSCHGSTPQLGLNPLELGAKILVECSKHNTLAPLRSLSFGLESLWRTLLLPLTGPERQHGPGGCRNMGKTLRP